MISLILKQIWNKRRSNGWLFMELFIVFIILWYIVEFLFTSFVTSHQYKGYDTDHVYDVSIFANPTLSEEYKGEDWKNNYLLLFNRIKEYPGVESACYYGGSALYGGGMFENYTVDSIRYYFSHKQMVNKDFFEVFKVPMKESDLSQWEMRAYPRPAVISQDLADSLFHVKPQLGEHFFQYSWATHKYMIGGVAPRHKRTEFDRYAPFIYVPIEEWLLEQSIPTMAIRVDKRNEQGFAERFTSDMRNLNIGPFYFSGIMAYNEKKEIYDTQTNNYLRTSYAVVLFFVFNIFLSVMGTFWFRTRKRRGEIGLRMAIGASRFHVASELIYESILILILSAIPAILICLNVWYLDITINTYMDSTVPRFVIGISCTLILMAIMILLGIIYPVTQATKIEPAEALHEE